MLAYKKQFAEQLATQFSDLNTEILIQQIQLTPEDIEGDLAFPCFRFAKEFKKSPQIIAQEVVKKLNNENIIAVGPYINFKINNDKLAQELITKILTEKDKFWQGEKTDKTLLIEWRQPNTHKSFHIGHIRNALISESVARISEFAGNTVIKVCYPWDIGAHVAKWIWYYTNFYDGTLPTENFTKRAGELYATATSKVDENKEKYSEQIHELQKNLENGDPELQKIWKETRQLCLDDMKNIFEELGTTKLDRRYYESEVEQPGIKKVQEMLEQGIAIKSQWAVAMNLEDYNLGYFLLLKSNWASLYSTKDIALAQLKQQEYPEYTDSLYVVGSEQEHHFNQLFKTLELIGFDYKKLHHLSYGLVDLAEGKMSSRAGNVILYEDFRDELLEKASELVADREIEENKKQDIIKKVAFASMKYGMLLQDSEKRIIFDKEKSLSFTGETGPYIQYTYARCTSILKKAKSVIPAKAGISTTDIDYSLLNTDEEKNILLHLAQLEKTVQKAAKEYKPNYIARYILELAKIFNSYYQKHKIIQENKEQKNLENARIILVQAVQQVIHNACHLLGIEVVEEM